MELETGSPMINAKMLARSRAEVLVVPAPAIKIVMEFACERWPNKIMSGKTSLLHQAVADAVIH